MEKEELDLLLARQKMMIEKVFNPIVNRMIEEGVLPKLIGEVKITYDNSSLGIVKRSNDAQVNAKDLSPTERLSEEIPKTGL